MQIAAGHVGPIFVNASLAKIRLYAIGSPYSKIVFKGFFFLDYFDFFFVFRSLETYSELF